VFLRATVRRAKEELKEKKKPEAPVAKGTRQSSNRAKRQLADHNAPGLWDASSPMNGRVGARSRRLRVRFSGGGSNREPVDGAEAGHANDVPCSGGGDGGGSTSSSKGGSNGGLDHATPSAS